MRPRWGDRAQQQEGNLPDSNQRCGNARGLANSYRSLSALVAGLWELHSDQISFKRRFRLRKACAGLVLSPQAKLPDSLCSEV